MASDLTGSKCFRLTVLLAVFLGQFSVTASNAFAEEELRANFDYEAEDSAYPDQFEEIRSVESGEENDLRFYGLRYRNKKYPNYVNYGQYHQKQQAIPVRPQPYYRTCRDAPQCKPCKAPKVPAYQPSTRSVRVESRTWEYQFDETQSSQREYELRSYGKRYQHTKPSLPQCNKQCKVEIPEVIKKPYFNPAAQYHPPGYGR